MSITYGKTTPSAYTDPEIVAVNKNIARFGQVAKPGAYLVDAFPILRFVPGYLNQLKAWHKEELTLFDGQLGVVRKQMREGTAVPSSAKFILENQRQYDLQDKELSFLLGGIFGAGADTVGLLSVLCPSLATINVVDGYFNHVHDDGCCHSP